ncbi:threonine ammonia-lyase IlvA [Janibacter sp. GXQ6167]|uniref:threonine ammonia-lyase IlvA n=1 Tax=Janibacter sp. GXQ6167 TaxID=3240791 RepID=UPI0035248A52
MTVLTATEVDAADALLSTVLAPTPLQRSERLTSAHGREILLKREDLQPVRSYKVRGAYAFIAGLTEEQRAKGVVAASAGNHAQGVAFACQRLGVTARIYLPRTTPKQKRDRVAAIGGDAVEVVVQGDVYDDAAGAALADAARSGATVVPAFDAAATMAGQGTVAAEIVRQLGYAPDVVVVPVGGGGLLGGVLAWFSENHPTTRIVGVEPEGARSMHAALRAGGPVVLDEMDSFVDGAAVRRVGDLTFAAAAPHDPEVLGVAEGAVCVEMLSLYQVDGIIAEPAGSLAPAALAQIDLGALPADATVVAIVSGGNNDVSRYAEIHERALIHEGRKHYFLVEFRQEPGALRTFLDTVLGPDDDIALFEYVKRSNRETGPALVGIELGSAADLGPLLSRMDSSPLRIERIEPTSPLFRFIQ